VNFLQNYYLNSTAGVDLLIATHEAKRAIRDSGVKNGLLTLLVTNGSAGVALLENDAKLIERFKDFIVRLVPEPEKKPARPSRRSGSGHDFAHLRAALVGSNVSLPIKDSKLVMGAWLDVVVLDFDDKIGRREITIQITGE